MAILKGDVKLVKSAVMADVPEGGGAPTANVVVDGTSNAIFPDVSESDRAAGRVSLRKVHAWIQSDDIDTYLGANIIVAEPPNDPNVAITLCSTESTFDQRASAVAQIEAYLSIGGIYPAYLFSNHITGQDTVLMFQKSDELPAIGSTLVLTKREGFSDQFRQYIRVIEAKATLTQYEDDRGTYARYIVEIKLANRLDADFPGFDVKRFEYTAAELKLATKISSTVVADAAEYSGVVALEDAAVIGDFTIKTEGIFSQLVPSAQIETNIADARTNQLSAAQQSAGATVSRVMTGVLDTTHSFFVGGQIAPNTLSIANGGITLTDSGGRLMSSGSQVGTVDYENGILALSVNTWGVGVSLPYTIVYSLAGSPEGVNKSMGFQVTDANRATGFVRTISPPVPGTLRVDYRAQGKWYTLKDDGAGALRGADTAYGGGFVNFTTGTISATFGALPDVGSDVIYQWIEPEAARDSDLLTLQNDGKVYWVFNTSGASIDTAGSKVIEPGAVSITWSDGGTRTVTDNGAGVLTGYGTGTVDYSRGIIKLSPTVLPPPGTAMTVNLSTNTKTSSTPSIGSGAGNLGATNIEEGSVSMIITAQPRITYGGVTSNVGPAQTYSVRDNGAGGLQIRVGDQWIACGTVTYSTGAFALSSTVALNSFQTLLAMAFENFYVRSSTPQFTLEVI
jgi:hypothetical protein